LGAERFYAPRYPAARETWIHSLTISPHIAYGLSDGDIGVINEVLTADSPPAVGDEQTDTDINAKMKLVRVPAELAFE